MAYSKQTWDTTSYVNPTRMNHIEDGIKDNALTYKDITVTTSTNQYVGPYLCAGAEYVGVAKNKVISLVPMGSFSVGVTFYFQDNTDSSNARILVATKDPNTVKVRVWYLDN